MMLVQFGGFREDVIGTLGPFLGQDKVARMIDDAMAYVRSEAEAGARKGVEAEIPKIRSQVKEEATKTIKPWMIALVVISLVGVGLGGFALWRTRRKH